MAQRLSYHPPGIKPQAWHQLNPGGVVDQPGNTSQFNKTGGWRSFRPVVDKTKCNKCGLCWIYCPDAAMIELEDHYSPDLDFCKGCGICAYECPREAIQMVAE